LDEWGNTHTARLTPAGKRGVGRVLLSRIIAVADVPDAARKSFSRRQRLSGGRAITIGVAAVHTSRDASAAD
jgi:HD-GYP domain-containing protein (c-di-GMP phosphodiesterase class II)